jgi:hypothetical protein
MLELDDERVNVNGGAVALGWGGGQGDAVIIRRPQS